MQSVLPRRPASAAPEAPQTPAAGPGPAPGSVLAEMLRGYRPLDEVVEGLDLAWHQRLRCALLVCGVMLYRLLVLPLRRRAVARLDAELDALRALRIRTHGATGARFTADERRAFERDGLLGPFEILPVAEAEALADSIREGFATDFDGDTVLGDPLRSALKRQGAWNNQMAGMFRGLRSPELRALLRRPAVAERLAGILGDEVMCWRTQFFEKAPGAEGTFWHQTSTFRESSSAAKLTPTRPMDEAIVQLTVWMALSDVTVKTGALRVVPGSFADGRVEHMYYFAKDNLPLFLALLLGRVSPRRVYRLIAVARHAMGNFVRSQAVLEGALALLDDDPFAGRHVRDLEMRAGQAVIFTSLNMHASHPNTTADETRLALVARCAANHVQADHRAFDYPTPEGLVSCPLPEITCFQVHGTDSHGLNRLLPD